MKRIREWKSMLIPYEQAVEELKVKFKSIRNEYRELNDYSPIEFVTGRVKKISSILEKAKRRDIDEDQIEDLMEDIAGIRIMCQFKDDIYKVVELIRARDGKDLRIVYEKDYIENIKESGYRSYHMIIRYAVQTAFGEKDILAEIQIRTLAMNFWATIEHSLNYKYQTNIPENVRNQLRTTAEAASRLDEEMCEIRNEIINAQLMFEERSIWWPTSPATSRSSAFPGRRSWRWPSRSVSKTSGTSARPKTWKTCWTTSSGPYRGTTFSTKGSNQAV